jgi:hypothetical protein
VSAYGFEAEELAKRFGKTTAPDSVSLAVPRCTATLTSRQQATFLQLGTAPTWSGPGTASAP